ncbi:TonB-dependent receptor [Sphingomicrobium clamense]|uniref:TonB-dependent receptor n=1 Tax=Sphingomicrobium clamense TaxID=2851013 RepID=A0ABS6V2S1_9SPHN|nr:TonB-dependent receptor [Sphingomicrobium sp. B8]MBW0143836.1 TonB-dependent receptor [Sphingomicrobium sp. B8]
MRHARLLTAASSFALLLHGAPALAQDAATRMPQDDAFEADDSDDAAIVVTAPRGSVAGDIPPEEVLDSRDILATGATSVAELLDALSPQIGSGRGRGGRGGGGRPIILIEGKRVSGWRELRDLPTEAIERVDILPEEVAVQYGYAADQRVVNFVLREAFNSTGIELEGEFATRGGRMGGEIELDRLMIRNGTRTTFAFEAEAKSALTEDERDVLIQPVEAFPDPVDPRPYRTLLPATEDYQLNVSHSRPLGEKSLTATLGLDQSTSRSRFGAPIASFDIPAASPFADPPGEEGEVSRLVAGDALGRSRRSRTAELATALNGGGDWRWSTTGSINVANSRTRSDRGPDVDAFQLGLDALDPSFDPFGSLTLGDYPQDISRSRSVRGEVDGLVSGQLGETGAGPIGLSLRSQLTWSNFQSEGTTFGIADPDSDLTRRRLLGRATIDLPVLDRDSAIGQLSFNANGVAESLSDFGELFSYGAGVNWRPTRKLSFLASFDREEGSPSLTQLGEARVVEPLVSFFDFTNGETVLVDAITGGNPDLVADTREVLKISGNWQLPTKDDLRLTAEYITERIDNPIGSFPAASAALEAAFPDRFFRDGDGTLVGVDLTPVNYARQSRDSLRWGLSWGKTLETKPPSAETRAKLRERFRQMRQERQRERAQQQPQGEGPPTPPQPQAEGQQQAEREGPPQGQQRRRGGRGPGGFIGRGRNGGRLGVNIFHTVNFSNEVEIAEGLPLLDYLDGEAVGRFGGTPRHEIEARAFRYNNGLGLRLSADWRSATTVDSAAGPIRFDDYAKFDLRLWYNLAEKPGLIADNPWMRGMRVRVGIDNIFDARPKVTAADGSVPFTYQPAYLEPEGRTISLSIRKLIVPRRFIRDEIRRRTGR